MAVVQFACSAIKGVAIMRRTLGVFCGTVLLTCLSVEAVSGVLDPRRGIPDCPALDDGQRLQLSPPLAPVSFVSNVDYSDPVFLSAAKRAKNVASYFENAGLYKPGRASYDGIGPMDGISIGQMQWNWKDSKGTLVYEFFKPIPNALLDDTSDPQLKADLATLASFARSGSGISDAKKVISRWQSYIDKQTSPLAKWLRSNGVKKYQDELVERRFGLVLRLAKTWMQDRQYDDEHFERVLTTLANFNIHAGLSPDRRGLRDVWAPQVDSFVSALGNDRNKIFKYVLDWMRSCKPAHIKMTKKKDAFGYPGGLKGNIEIWGDPTFISSLSKEQVDLFAYAFIYATRSNTQWSTFPKGYSQLDVLQRAGVIILDKGTALAADWDPSKF